MNFLLSGSLRLPQATLSGEPDAGNPHVRFDEGAARRALRASRVALLYSTQQFQAYLATLTAARKQELLQQTLKDVAENLQAAA